MKVSVAVAMGASPVVVEVDLPVAGATVADALAAAAARHEPLAGLRAALLVGVWGKLVARDRALREGDRVEVYLAVRADAKAMRRERARATAPSARRRSAP